MKQFLSLAILFLAVACTQPRTIVQTPSGDAAMNRFITDLMNRMTLDEKIGQLNLLTPGGGIPTGAVVNPDVEGKIKSGSVGGLFGVSGVVKIKQAQDIAVNGSRLKIPLIFGSDVIHGYKTTFPIPLALASSWDMKMIERSARIAAIESSADGLSWTFSPMVDIARDPRWGRVAEGAGEDPYLGSQIARAMVKGYQQDNLAADNTLMACVKHFALYGASEGGRDYNTVDMSRVKMFEYYMPPYKAAIDAGVGSVMTSFNEVDGIPATGNRWLLNDVLRNQWGFDGFIVTDYTSINEMVDHGSGNLQQVSAMALRAGVDMDMVGEGFLTTLKKSLSEGLVTQAEIDQACRRVLEAKYKLGLFEDPYRYLKPERAAQQLRSAEHLQAAKEFAQRSMVLMKNNNNLMPLRKSGTIALIGPLANDTSNMTGTWTVNGDKNLATPVLEGMRKAAGGATILYSKGANITNDSALAKRTDMFGARVVIDSTPSDQLLQQAVETARRADVVVAVVGEGAEFSGEASSRTDITLPESQRNLLAALKATGKPLVVVLFTGRPLALEWESQHADALLNAWFAGHEAGPAVASVLFGEYNPSGKLPMTFPRNVGQVPIYYNHKNTGRPQPDGPNQKFRSNYLDVPNSPLYPFGYGLSYTTFSYGDLKLSSNRMTSSEKITASITVTNTGRLAGEEVVQLYIHDKVASVTQPLKKLKGFQKIMLQPGESKEVQFQVGTEELSFFNSNLQWVYESGEFTIMVGGNSVDVKRAELTLNR